MQQHPGQTAVQGIPFHKPVDEIGLYNKHWHVQKSNCFRRESRCILTHRLLAFGDIIRSMLIWLGLTNLLTALLRTPVLGWFARRNLDALAGVTLAGLLGWRGRPTLWALPLALPLQLAAASVRGMGYHPLSRLAPHPANRCEAVLLPLAQGAIPGLLLQPASASSAGVVVCHGAGADKTYYAWRLIDALLGAGLVVLAIDLDGHGANQRRLQVPGISENVQVAVEWLRTRCSRVGLVGVSLGGCVAAQAVAAGVAVDGLAIVEAPIKLDLSNVAYKWAEFWTLVRPAFWRASDRVTPLQLLRGWATRPINTQHRLAELFDLLDLKTALPHITCPMVLIYGTNDVIAPFAPLQRLLPHLSNATLHLHGGAGHLSLTMEQAPLADLAAWLQTTLQA